MKLLFDYDTYDGDKEISDLIGHIDKDIEFDNLKSDIISATKDIIKIIGQPVYDSATTLYEAKTAVESELDLIRAIRYPIALEGYRQNAKSSDVIHSNNGRKIRVDDHIKVPFQWMIDNDNENLERKYYKAVDELIDYLDANSALWKASSAYANSQKYFVRKTADFEEYYPISSRLLLLKLLPGIKQCERMHIIPLITQVTSDGLKTKLQADTALDAAETALLEVIKEACIYHALSWGMKVLRITLFPEGILQPYVSDRQSTKSRKVAEKLEVELAAQTFKAQSQEALKQIEILLSQTIVPIDEVTADCITTPKFKFDDCDGFVSL